MAFLAPIAGAALAGGGASALGGSLATALSVGSAAFTGLTGFQQASFNRQVARINAEESARAANLEADAAQQEQLRSDREFRALIGEQLAHQSASGLDVLGRSQLQVRENTRRVAGEAATDIRRTGEERSRKLFRDAANSRGEAKAAGRQAFNSLVSIPLRAATEIKRDKQLRSNLLAGARSIRKKF